MGLCAQRAFPRSTASCGCRTQRRNDDSDHAVEHRACISGLPARRFVRLSRCTQRPTLGKNGVSSIRDAGAAPAPTRWPAPAARLQPSGRHPAPHRISAARRPHHVACFVRRDSREGTTTPRRRPMRSIPSFARSTPCRPPCPVGSGANAPDADALATCRVPVSVSRPPNRSMSVHIPHHADTSITFSSSGSIGEMRQYFPDHRAQRSRTQEAGEAPCCSLRITGNSLSFHTAGVIGPICL